MAKPDFNTIEEALEQLQARRMIVVVDERARDVDGAELVGEGELVMIAELADSDAINFVTRHAGGPVYVAAEKERLEKLGLESARPGTTGPRGASYMVPVNARDVTGTGVSARDRALTIRHLADPESSAAHFLQPGHVTPIAAQPGGVLRRAGHTEASVDLARMAQFQPVAVIASILDDDGELASTPHLLEFAALHDLTITTIRDLISYRRRSEKLIELEARATMPTRYGDFTVYAYRSIVDGSPYIALATGEIDNGEPTLVRMHSCCVTGDALGSHLCDCGDQLERALQMISQEGRGVLVYIQSHEGRGIGLVHKLKAYELQQKKGLDTIEANHALGLPADARDYGVGAQVLSDLGLRQLRLMTNNPKKRVGMEGYGLTVVEQVAIQAEPNPHNIRYLETKRDKMGHTTLLNGDRNAQSA
ncbi:MAG: GTP cyclohydrolase II [Candidatus Latescibacterota bacterium]|nr:GTP cyclohydrolase II [Candidatus Latescibacterota bacterium]